MPTRPPHARQLIGVALATAILLCLLQSTVSAIIPPADEAGFSVSPDGQGQTVNESATNQVERPPPLSEDSGMMHDVDDIVPDAADLLLNFNTTLSHDYQAQAPFPSTDVALSEPSAHLLHAAMDSINKAFDSSKNPDGEASNLPLPDLSSYKVQKMLEAGLGTESGTLYDLEKPIVALETETEEHSTSQRRNYAAQAAGAIVMAGNPEMGSVSALLNGDADAYALSKCDVKKWVVIALSEEVIVDTIVLSNEEKYSSSVENFRVLGSVKFPAVEWVVLGNFSAANKLGEQSFAVSTRALVRYLKLVWVTHHGSEFYCTMTKLKVFGTTAMDDLRENSVLENEPMRYPFATMTAPQVTAANSASTALIAGVNDSTVSNETVDMPNLSPSENGTHPAATSILARTTDASVVADNISIISLVASTRAMETDTAEGTYQQEALGAAAAGSLKPAFWSFDEQCIPYSTHFSNESKFSTWHDTPHLARQFPVERYVDKDGSKAVSVAIIEGGPESLPAAPMALVPPMDLPLISSELKAEDVPSSSSSRDPDFEDVASYLNTSLDDIQELYAVNGSISDLHLSNDSFYGALSEALEIGTPAEGTLSSSADAASPSAASPNAQLLSSNTSDWIRYVAKSPGYIGSSNVLKALVWKLQHSEMELSVTQGYLQEFHATFSASIAKLKTQVESLHAGYVALADAQTKDTTKKHSEDLLKHTIWDAEHVEHIVAAIQLEMVAMETRIRSDMDFSGASGVPATTTTPSDASHAVRIQLPPVLDDLLESVLAHITVPADRPDVRRDLLNLVKIAIAAALLALVLSCTTCVVVLCTVLGRTTRKQRMNSYYEDHDFTKDEALDRSCCCRSRRHVPAAR